MPCCNAACITIVESFPAYFTIVFFYS